MSIIDTAFSRLAQIPLGMYVRNMDLAYPVRLEGVDSFMSIPDVLKQKGAYHPLIVTGPRIGKSSFFASMVQQLEGEYTVYDKVQPDPCISQIEEMVEIYKKEGCDSFIAIGGGSNMDAAKACSARIARPEKSLPQLAHLFGLNRPTPLFIAVPTTAGTGSETTVAAVIRDEKTGHKYAINDGNLCPNYAVLDPNLTVSLPPEQTAFTGMDALTHAVEAYLNKPYHIKTTVDLCEDAVAAIVEFLPKAFANGENLEAREEMLIASFKAGEAFTVACVGNVHAIAHAIGGLYHVPHGKANTIVLPYVLEEYGAKVYEPLARLAEVSEVCTEGSTETKAKAFIAKIREMNASFGIPDTIPKIKPEDIEKMSAWAAHEANPLYPCPVVFDKARFARLLKKISGR